MGQGTPATPLHRSRKQPHQRPAAQPPLRLAGRLRRPRRSDVTAGSRAPAAALPAPRRSQTAAPECLLPAHRPRWPMGGERGQGAGMVRGRQRRGSCDRAKVSLARARPCGAAHRAAAAHQHPSGSGTAGASGYRPVDRPRKAAGLEAGPGAAPLSQSSPPRACAGPGAEGRGTKGVGGQKQRLLWKQAQVTPACIQSGGRQAQKCVLQATAARARWPPPPRETDARCRHTACMLCRTVQQRTWIGGRQETNVHWR